MSVRRKMGYFSALLLLDLFLNTTWITTINQAQKVSTAGNFYLEHYGKVYGFSLLLQEKQVRKDSILFTVTITDFLFTLS